MGGTYEQKHTTMMGPFCDTCLFVVECTVQINSRVVIHTERGQARPGFADDTRPWRWFVLPELEHAF